ncbi:MAG: hypothetical protein OCC45_10410 [Desulfotalea sp.]
MSETTGTTSEKQCYPPATIIRLARTLDSTIILVEALQLHFADVKNAQGHKSFELVKADLADVQQSLEGGEHVR